MGDVEGFDVAELERKITALEQRFLETTIGVRDPKADEVDLLSQLRHRTNNIVDRIVSRPNLRFLFLFYLSFILFFSRYSIIAGLDKLVFQIFQCFF